jgi:class 3 adenylate cyclase/pimeloyl-ACP methyl ester carboxylesterase
MEPVRGYARLNGQRIYYQTIGEGPPDIVVNTGSWGALDVEWEDPGVRLFHQKAAELGRVISFDRRGAGASDPLPLDALPPWESFVDELECVMDHVGTEKATILGGGDGGPTTLLFAANRPERVSSMVLYCAYARLATADDYPFGIPPEQFETYVTEVGETWGTPGSAALWLPSKSDDPEFLSWMAKVQRSVYSPGAAEAFARQSLATDARALLSAIHVPTLVLHVRNNPLMRLDFGRYIADHIEGAEFRELDGTDASPYWEKPDQFLSMISSFVLGVTHTPVTDRRLAAVMFTDIVDSTEKAEELGDRSWRALLDEHDSTSRRLISQNKGDVIKMTGDGVLATFDGPGRAIRSAEALNAELSKVGVSLRTGIHTGEIEFRGADVGGLAVHLASRVMALAEPGQILVTRTVKDLVVGSHIPFTDRGSQRLKGIEGDWQLYSVGAAT